MVKFTSENKIVMSCLNKPKPNLRFSHLTSFSLTIWNYDMQIFPCALLKSLWTNNKMFKELKLYNSTWLFSKIKSLCRLCYFRKEHAIMPILEKKKNIYAWKVAALASISVRCSWCRSRRASAPVTSMASSSLSIKPFMLLIQDMRSL